MRVTQETKSLTRQRILDAARALFTAHGFDATTTLSEMLDEVIPWIRAEQDAGRV